MRIKKENKNWTYVNIWYILIPLIIVTLFFVVPLFKLFLMSFQQTDSAGIVRTTLQNYTKFLTDGYYLSILAKTFMLSLVSVFFCILMGYPIAYLIVRSSGIRKSVFTSLVVLPLWVSITIRMYGWMTVLGKQGLISEFLRFFCPTVGYNGLVGTNIAVLIGLVHCGLPYMIMILIGPIENVEGSLVDASSVFGANPFQTFFSIMFPLTLPGVISGALVVFSLNTAAFMVPVMLGGGKVLVIPNMIYQQALFVFDWGFAAAVSVILLVTSIIIVSMSNILQNQRWQTQQ